MSLQIKLPDKFGNGGVEYFKIVETNINWLTRSAHIVLAGWINEQARLDGKEPMDTKSFDLAGDEFPFDIEKLSEEGVNTLSVAYEVIKEPKIEEEKDTNVFSKAVDLL